MSKTGAEHQRNLRARRRAAGQCVVCQAPSPGTARCVKCRRRDAARQTERQRALSEQGLCKMCGREKVKEGSQYCAGCLEKANAASRRQRVKNKQQGRCISCGGSSSGVRCQDCNRKMNVSIAELRARRKTQGLCRDCGRPAQMVDRTGQHHAPGGPKEANYCQECFLKMTAGYVLGSRKHWRVLVEKLEAAGWKCAYTGEALVLGENLSFDHKNPVCRFPEQRHDPENVEPVTLMVNLMKRHMTRKEFLALIGAIWRHAGSGG